MITISPLKDILIGTGIGVGAALLWRNHAQKQAAHVEAFYKWYDANQAKKATQAASDDDDDE